MENSKNFKQLIMSALYAERNSDLPTEALAWVASNLPDSNQKGEFKENTSTDIEHLWDDFEGFKTINSRSAYLKKGVALQIRPDTLETLMRKIQKGTKEQLESPSFDPDNVNEVNILKLTKNLTKEELAFIVVTGIGAFAEKMQEIAKEQLWRDHQRDND